MAQSHLIKQALASAGDIAKNHLEPAPIVQLHSCEVAKAVQEGRITLTISPLLGCDYVFINHRGVCELLNEQHIAHSIHELLEFLELSPRQCVIVSVNEIPNEELIFTRHDYTWQHHRVSQVNSTKVTLQEQIDFMHMMLNCSTNT